MGIKKIPLTQKQKEQLANLGYSEEEINSETLVDAALYKEAMSGNVSALLAVKKEISNDTEDTEELIKDISNEVKKEEKKLLNDFKALTPAQLKVNAELIHNIAFQGVTLRHLADNIAKYGVKEKYKNGANQWGYKDRAEVKTYNIMIKNYQSCMKQINDLLISNNIGYEKDEFDDFNK